MSMLFIQYVTTTYTETITKLLSQHNFFATHYIICFIIAVSGLGNYRLNPSSIASRVKQLVFGIKNILSKK